MSQRNTKLNLLKGFACMSVVFIHILFPGTFGEIVKYGSNYAVPVFLMITGYYAFECGTEVIKRRLIKIIKVFLYAYMLHFAYFAAVAAKNHELVAYLTENFNLQTPIKYIFFSAIEFSIPLWYLIAMIETYIFWYFVVKNKKEKTAIKFLPALFVFRILILMYLNIMSMPMYFKYNFIISALPYFLLGYYMNTNEAENLEISLHVS